ncbi:hypothetical protein Taro_031439 [Colocasia esculenta]|uniref:Retrotransposon gag domain-containing protein n=1 Tax=Colocasia esculenta TaxID=4460 RepID=A0A843VWP5_COLES|nr:hypothetical protein [Colocasia esculenta]
MGLRGVWPTGCGGLVGLHSSLYLFSGAAAGPFVRGCETERWSCVFFGSFPTDPVTHEAHPYLLPGEGVQEIVRPSSSGGSAPPAVNHRYSQRQQYHHFQRRQAVPVVPVPPPPGVEVPPVVPVQPAVPVRSVTGEETTVLVERFLRLQPPTYSGGPNPDTTEHWIHEIERVFAIMRCPQEDRVFLAAYQLRGFAQEWWWLKMQTVFTGRAEDTAPWSEFLSVFNDSFFPIQIQQMKREQFRTFQQGNLSVLEYQMRFIALSRYAPYVVTDNTMMV